MKYVNPDVGNCFTHVVAAVCVWLSIQPKAEIEPGKNVQQSTHRTIITSGLSILMHRLNRN